MGKSSVRQTEGRRECLLAEIWFHAKKECCRFIYFKVVDGEVQIRGGGSSRKVRVVSKLFWSLLIAVIIINWRRS